jgi:hypothetical protein
MPPKRKHDPGYKLPEVIEPEENCCICIPIPNDFNHKMAFLGQLDELGYWWNWERDPDKKGREAAAVWRKIVECIREEMDMSGCGCGDDKPTNTRINPETGLYEVSYDGGITWEPSPGDDPRSSGTVFPPIAGDPGDALRCVGANSALGFLQDVQAQELAGLEANATIADFIQLLTTVLGAIGIFFAFVPSAIAAMLGFVVNFFGHKIAADFEAAFTEALWDELFCILYCHIEDDGSYTEAGWQAVKGDLDNDISNYGLGWMYNHINLIGTVGLTNAARSSYVGTRDCGQCDACDWCYEFDFTIDEQGWTAEPWGLYVAAAGWRSVNIGTLSELVQIGINVPGVTIKSLEAFWTWSTIPDRSNGVLSYGSASLVFDGLSPQILEDEEFATGLGIAIGNGYDGGTGGTATVYKAIVCGSGTNPFE